MGRGSDAKLASRDMKDLKVDLSGIRARWSPSLADKKTVVMRAHCIYNGWPKTNDKHRTLIFNLLRYSNRQSILQASSKNPLSLSGKEIKFFPDYSNYTAQRCKGFSQLIGWARSQGLQTFLKNNSEEHLFKTGADAEEFLDSLGSSGLVWAQCPSSSSPEKGWNMMEEDPSPGASDLSSF
ncbi:UNVERIFIED_CONTAM: hypothetical protein FKN15_073076 [Acipenser sinensis]